MSWLKHLPIRPLVHLFKDNAISNIYCCTVECAHCTPSEWKEMHYRACSHTAYSMIADAFSYLTTGNACGRIGPMPKIPREITKEQTRTTECPRCSIARCYYRKVHRWTLTLNAFLIFNNCLGQPISIRCSDPSRFPSNHTFGWMELKFVDGFLSSWFECDYITNK